MSWNNFSKTEQKLKTALDSFDWKSTSEIGSEIVDRIRVESAVMPSEPAARILRDLQRKSRLETLARVAEALIQSGQRSPGVQRRYAQALIDLGYLYPAEHVLRDLVEEARGTPEEAEARGLLGRVYKQIYVNGGQSPKQRRALEQAVEEYLIPWLANPKENTWHGINIVALTFLARRNGVSWKGMPGPEAVAKDVLEIMGAKATAPDGLRYFDLATAMDAHIALRQHQKALERALEYTADKNADAFEIGSTLRQLVEVWGLTETKEPGKSLLPLLRAALISRQGGAVRVNTMQANSDSKPAIRHALEAVFGANRFVPLKCYQLGLERAKSVVRIEKPNGQGHGTGWLVDGGEFFPHRTGELLVVTNHHVVGDYPGALRPGQAKANLQMLKTTIDVKELIWTSDVDKLDVSFLSLAKKPPKAAPLPLAEEPIELGEPAPRLFIIGHPGGRDLEFSLEDSLLIGCNDRLLHYRAPTEGGSSGSPVFEDQEWKVVALHHAGGDEMQRISGKKGIYQANEGIRIAAIQKATRADRPKKKK